MRVRALTLLFTSAWQCADAALAAAVAGRAARSPRSRSSPALCADSSWLPTGTDEATLRRHFHEAARQLHPDVNGADAEAVAAQFKELSDEYSRLRAACRSDAQREELTDAWMKLGGLAAAVAMLSGTAIVVPATIAATMHSVPHVAKYVGKHVSRLVHSLEQRYPVSVAAADAEEAAAVARSAYDAELQSAFEAELADEAWHVATADARRRSTAALLAGRTLAVAEQSLRAAGTRAREARRVKIRHDLPDKWISRLSPVHRKQAVALRASLLADAFSTKNAETRARRIRDAARVDFAARSSDRRAAVAEAQATRQTAHAARRTAGGAAEVAADAKAALGIASRRADALKTTESDAKAVVASAGGLGMAIGAAGAEALASAVSALLP